MSHPNDFTGSYEGGQLDHLAFPVGGLGAGMFCVEGTGALTHFSVQNRPDIWNAPMVFSAISVKGEGREANVARVLEGPVPSWKPFFPWERHARFSGMGGGINSFGLPRFDSARFTARFPFAEVTLQDAKVPLECSLKAWSPFIPGNEDDSGLPVGALEYRFKNPTAKPVEAVWSFHMRHFLARPTLNKPVTMVQESQKTTGMPGGFVLRQGELPEDITVKTDLAAWVDAPDAKVNLALFRGGWFDALTMVWKSVADGELIEQGAITEGKPSPGGSIYVPLLLAPGGEKTVRLTLAWRSPVSALRTATSPHERPLPEKPEDNYRPWYAEKFKSIEAIVEYWTKNRDRLLAESETFTDCFYDSTLPPEVIDAVSANLSILKSPTILRQFDGRLWGWEGCQDDWGSCHGTCTHVWNYAQSIPHLFPRLEQTLRDTEFLVSQDEKGHQSFRSDVPIAPCTHDFHAAADGQLGGLMKLYRDWRIGGDTAWLRKIWPAAKKSLAYCIEHWDPDHTGALVEPHHNTYDIEFWGPDGMCTSFYLAALAAAVEMGRALGDDVSLYEKLLAAGVKFTDRELFNGEYYEQKVQWIGLHAKDPIEACKIGVNMDYSPEAQVILAREGPKYQYGTGCLSDGVLGEFMAWSAGLDPSLDRDKIGSHLLAVHHHNLVADLSKTPNPQRPAYGFNHEAGLLLCSWPRGGRLSLPFPYSEEVWTGIEYQVAAHLISFGHVAEGLEIVRACRSRYDGRVRNPFDEIECGHWYARAMASYALLQALTGARYDAVDKTLHLEPQVHGDFRSFLSTATGFGTVGVKKGKPFLEVRHGEIDVKQIKVHHHNQPA
jgi:uncharacterized protein (DUF608 family)